MLVVESNAGRAEFTITRLNPLGRVRFERVIRYRPVPLSQHDVDAAVDFLLPPSDAGRRAVVRDDILKALYRPATLPPVTGALIGSDGSIWVRREDQRTSAHQRWLVLDSKGATRHEVLLDRRVIPFHVAGDAGWGLLTNEDGTTSPVHFRLASR